MSSSVTNPFEDRGGLGRVRNRHYPKIAWLAVRDPHRRKLELQFFYLLEHGGLRKLGKCCGRRLASRVSGGPSGAKCCGRSLASRVSGGPSGAYIWQSGLRGSEVEVEVLLDGHPGVMQRLKIILSKLKPVHGRIAWHNKAGG